MKIAITGALGHIGSRLIRELPSAFRDAEIVMLDDLSTQRYCSLFGLPPEERYRFVEADILTADLEATFAGCDVVVHLAAITDATTSFEKRDLVEQVNVLGTRRVAEACLKTGSALIFPSTTSVYGTQQAEVDEECAPSELRPQSPYAESKLEAERLLTELGEAEGLRFITCRFGTIFGVSPGMRFHTAINKFCWQAALGQPITVWRTALHQSRPYLDLADAMEAIKLIFVRGLYDRRIYNVLTLNTTVQEIVKVLTSSAPDVTIRYVDSRIMNQLSYVVADRRFRAQGFTPRGCLEEGVEATIRLLRGVRWPLGRVEVLSHGPAPGGGDEG